MTICILLKPIDHLVCQSPDLNRTLLPTMGYGGTGDVQLTNLQQLGDTIINMEQEL